MDADPRRRVRIAAWLALSIAAGGLVVLLQACFETAAPPPPPAPPPESQLLSPAALARLFAALAGVEARTAEQPVRILQLGDSHTANDSLSGRLRERMQSSQLRWWPGEASR